MTDDLTDAHKILVPEIERGLGCGAVYMNPRPAGEHALFPQAFVLGTLLFAVEVIFSSEQILISLSNDSRLIDFHGCSGLVK